MKRVALEEAHAKRAVAGALALFLLLSLFVFACFLLCALIFLFCVCALFFKPAGLAAFCVVVVLSCWATCASLLVDKPVSHCCETPAISLFLAPSCTLYLQRSPFWSLCTRRTSSSTLATTATKTTSMSSWNCRSGELVRTCSTELEKWIPRQFGATRVGVFFDRLCLPQFLLCFFFPFFR